jgi:ribonucleoside-diphosphate reductase subunit M2
MSIVETPSKATANALSTMDLNTPRKESAQPTLLEKLKASADVAKPVVVEETNKEQELEEYRKRFVGDLDCEEKDEPLLQESNSRFVLFPIKYREVSLLFFIVLSFADELDLADVQAGSGFVSSSHHLRL